MYLEMFNLAIITYEYGHFEVDIIVEQIKKGSRYFLVVQVQ